MSTDPATFDVPPFPVRRLSVGEFLRMIRDDVFADAGRLELLEGWIVPRTTWDPPQAVTVELASDAIRAALPDGWHRRTRGTVTTADSVPEPALSVVRGAIRDYARAHPTGVDAALVVEFAPPAWPGDPAIKNRIYARASIPAYWAIRLADSRIEVHCDPTGPCAHPAYRRRDEYGPDDAIPLRIDGVEVARIAVRELLP